MRSPWAAPMLSALSGVTRKRNARGHRRGLFVLRSLKRGSLGPVRQCEEQAAALFYRACREVVISRAPRLSDCLTSTAGRLCSVRPVKRHLCWNAAGPRKDCRKATPPPYPPPFSPSTLSRPPTPPSWSRDGFIGPRFARSASTRGELESQILDRPFRERSLGFLLASPGISPFALHSLSFFFFFFGFSIFVLVFFLTCPIFIWMRAKRSCVRWHAC